MAAGAQAFHWPFFGGDSGRSGYQPVGSGETPVTFRWMKTEEGERNVQTSFVVTTGGVTTFNQRLAFGTAGGRVHLQLLPNGGPVGLEDGVDIDDGAPDADVFTGDGGSVSFADTSTPTSLGQVFAVHNDDDQGGPPAGDDIAIAQVDEAQGTLERDVPLAGTNGYTISSSVVVTAPSADDPATPADESGNRSLFFVATNGRSPRLFKVAIARSGRIDASIGPVTSVEVPGANPLASPAIIFLESTSGVTAPYVAVGAERTLRTFAAGDLSSGPSSGDLGGPVQTPAVPTTQSGSTPGAPGSGVPKAPFIYVAANAGGNALVHKLTQRGSAQTLESATPPIERDGAPAPALATDEKVGAAAQAGSSNVILTTAQNLYLLDTGDLSEAGVFSAVPLAEGRGFSRTTAAASGELIYVTRDNGQQFILKADDAQSVVNFTPVPLSERSATAYGQPAISNSFVAFAGDLGVFVYSNRCGNDLTGTDDADVITGSSGGDSVTARAGDDRVSAASGDDCLAGGEGADRMDGDSGRDRLSGEQGDDRLAGDEGRDTLGGGPGGDLLSGGEDRDRLFGDDGDNGLFGGEGSDGLAGGSGRDELVGNEGNDAVSGRAGDDVLSGGDDRDRLSGGPGNDELDGSFGDDRLFGDQGNDRLDGGPGRDAYSGGAGNDVVDAVNGVRDVIDCNSGRDLARADAFDRVMRCERLLRADASSPARRRGRIRR